MEPSVFDSLTPRERDCLRGVAALEGSGQIAQRLGIATGTVDSYIGSARTKLGARDRRHAARMLAEHDEAFARGGGASAAGDFAPQKSPGENPGLSAAARRTAFGSAIGADRSMGLLNDAVLDQRRFGDIPARPHWIEIVREIAGGARPGDLSFSTRGMLILAATVMIGFTFFAVSASVGALYGVASFLRSLSH